MSGVMGMFGWQWMVVSGVALQLRAPKRTQGAEADAGRLKMKTAAQVESSDRVESRIFFCDLARDCRS
ncbi:hypothetical protein PQQ51_11770 [Paraburkholderia xenovorans]|uniref:hypothetical protein n=1 Tax=Paraburkholderia xenovorans TaxID=36873 RepID=UPI0038BBAFB7